MSGLFGSETTQTTTPAPLGPEATQLINQISQLTGGQIDVQKMLTGLLGQDLSLESQLTPALLREAGYQPITTDSGAGVSQAQIDQIQSLLSSAGGAGTGGSALTAEEQARLQHYESMGTPPQLQSEPPDGQWTAGFLQQQKAAKDYQALKAKQAGGAGTPGIDVQALQDQLTQIFGTGTSGIAGYKRVESAAETAANQRVTDLQSQMDAIISGAQELSDADAKRIADVYAAQFQTGKSDILAGSKEALDQIRNVLTPARGLRRTDVPIQYQGEKVGVEATRQISDLAAQLSGQQAGAELQYPLTKATTVGALVGGEQQLAASAQQFQQQLRQTALQNQLALQTLNRQTGLGLLGIQPAGNTALAALIGNRGSTTTQSTGMNFGSLLTGAGTLLTGIGAVK